MKQFIYSTNKFNTFVFILFFSSISVYAQDVITLRNGTRIEAKVTEITSSELRYKRLEQLDGPTRVVPLADVFAINYEDGTREVINAVQSKEETQVVSQSSNIQSKETGHFSNDYSKFFAGAVLGIGTGGIFGLNGSYFLDERMGIGMTMRLRFEDDLESVTFAPVFSYHLKINNEKFFFPGSIGFGIDSYSYSYSYSSNYDDNNSGASLCFFFTAGAACRLTNLISIGMNFETVLSKYSYAGVTFGVNLHF